MNKFKKDPNHLLKYCLLTILVLGSLNTGLYLTKGLSLDLNFETWMYFLPNFGFLLCGFPSAILHNCAHGNTGPKRINDAVGEVLGTVMLYGFKGFRLGHMYHHKFPDNPKYDVHPPKGHSFPSFLVSPIKQTLDVIERCYYEEFGFNSKTRMNIRLQKITFNLGIALRVLFWVLLFGPELFLLFYLPIYALNIFVFAHINYVAHRENEDNTSEIINLDHNLYYRTVNKLSFGGYYHKNHHRRPQAFNPSKVVIENDVPYITYHHTDDLSHSGSGITAGAFGK